MHGDVLPRLAGALHDVGAARQLEQRRRRFGAGGEARVIARRPAGVAHLIAHGHIGFEGRPGDDEDLHLGLLGAGRRQRGELLLQLLDAAIEVALLHLGVEGRAVGFGPAGGDEREDLRPVGGRRRARLRRLPILDGRPARHLRQVLQQRLLCLRRVLLALDDAAVVAQLLDLVLDTLALGLQLLLIGARDVAAARIDRLDVEAGGRLAVDADGAGHGLGRKIAEDQRVLALLQRQPRGARRFRPGGENGDRLDARGDRNLVRQCMTGEDDQKQTRQCDDRAHGAAHPSYFPAADGRPWARRVRAVHV